MENKLVPAGGNALQITQQYPADRYNLLVPMQTVAEIAAIHKPVMNAVTISTDLNDKEIYVQEKARQAYRDNPATPAKYALTKKGLTKLMRAAGIKILSSKPVVPSTCQKCAAMNASIGKPVRCGSCPNKDVKYEVRISVPQLTGHALGTTNAESVFVAGEQGPELVARPAAAYATGTTNSDDYFIAGENGPELIVGAQGSTVFPTSETDRLISALNEKRQPLQVIYGGGNDDKKQDTATEQVKRILLEVAGSGTIEVNGGTDKATILEILTQYLKPVLMSIIQNEIYEEGELSYEY